VLARMKITGARVMSKKRPRAQWKSKRQKFPVNKHFEWMMIRMRSI
jgi:hypothetical protein